MAYISQEKKTALAPGIKAVLKKYGMKGTIATRHHSTLICNVSSGPLDIIGNMFELALRHPESHYSRWPVKPLYMQVNPHWISDNYTGKVKEFVQELKDAMDIGNHDRSDSQSDYFDVGWYIDINIGKWDKPYLLTA